MGKKKSLCDLEGHDFISTTAPNFRKCRRSGCNGAECFKNGQWVLVQWESGSKTLYGPYNAICALPCGGKPNQYAYGGRLGTPLAAREAENF